MTDENIDSPDNQNADASGDADMPSAIEVDVGKSMPTTQAQNIPTLGASAAPGTMIDATEATHSRSMLAEGMHFVGNAKLRGPFSVAGQIEGNLEQASDTQVSVVVTETGEVKGDITAHKISVMGRTEGVLDSGPGEVALHDSASVHGLVRYGRIQVNGADLNATLERVGGPAKKGA
ncbi:polymer-forming cytoskeletal protein [Hydrogenophaga sp. 5NK40-0174]|uniref:bactofilin family protein n=1 Tax=Hydrogenophaga sp. 5NK40-0174 TaxID=3127649 RepID=UPI00310C0027